MNGWLRGCLEIPSVWRPRCDLLNFLGSKDSLWSNLHQVNSQNLFYNLNLILFILGKVWLCHFEKAMQNDGKSHRLETQVLLMIPDPLFYCTDVCNVGDLGSIPGLGRSPEKWMATHSSLLACKIPWTEEPGGQQSMRSPRIRHSWATDTFTTFSDTFTTFSDTIPNLITSPDKCL